MEYAIPAEAVPEALNRVRTLVDRIGVPISFPVEVRVTAGDDIPLSTATAAAPATSPCTCTRAPAPTTSTSPASRRS